MQKITETEWTETVIVLVEKVKLRWPWFRVDTGQHANEICIQTETCTGNLDLRINRDPMYMRTEAKFGSGRGLLGRLSEVECGLSEYRAVLDALHFLASETAHTQIYADGKCPCNYCGATGDVRGTPCEHCTDGLR